MNEEDSRNLFDNINKTIETVELASSLSSQFTNRLDNWRQNSLENIDQCYKGKKQEFEFHLRQQQKQQLNQLTFLRNRIVFGIKEKTIDEHMFDRLNHLIASLENQVNQFQSYRLNISLAVVLNDFALLRDHISNFNEILPLSSSRTTVKLPTKCLSMSMKENLLLINTDFNLSVLDEKFKFIQSIQWNNEPILNMFCSQTLNRFILITSNRIFSVDEQLMNIERLPINGKNWLTGTCTNEYLFLVTSEINSRIFKYSLSDSFRANQEYPLFSINCQENESIHDLSSNNDLLAIVLRTKSQQIHLDLCSSETLERYWSFELNSMNDFYSYRCCPLKFQQWMLINPNNRELIHISNEGKLIKKAKYHRSLPMYAIQTDDGRFINIMTNECIHQHQLY
ncbi:unnamed protein product [Adineta ricciae]|uniref:Uncharacterized protein n=1 Tax=Adineta ricciae TaxID=249248 RepID=A0A815QQ35_ADIRI|nr:unnamed protein product [Adineta ricciae]CAF1620753.1 unnamed protein product [Adineta ricciae]